MPLIFYPSKHLFYSYIQKAKAVDISKKLEDYASKEGYGVGSYFTQKKNLVVVWSMRTTSDEMMTVSKLPINITA